MDKLLSGDQSALTADLTLVLNAASQAQTGVTSVAKASSTILRKEPASTVMAMWSTTSAKSAKINNYAPSAQSHTSL